MASGLQLHHSEQLHTVYVLRSSKNGRYYIGCTKDVELRLVQHNSGSTKSTKSFRPWEIVYTESFDRLAEARSREFQIKAWKNRAYMKRELGLDSPGL